MQPECYDFAEIVLGVGKNTAVSDADPGETRWLDEAEQQAWRAYLWGSRELESALDRDLGPYGLSLSEYELISMLSERPGERERMSVLADMVVQSRSRVTHTAARLEKRGWVRRVPAPEDGRGVVLVLTQAGRDKIEAIAPVHVESVRRNIVDLITSEQFQAIGEAMRSVRASISSVPPRDRAVD